MHKDHIELRRRPMFTPLFLPMILGVVAVGLLIWLWTAQTVTTVIVVRHAEKQPAAQAQVADDPALTPSGRLRAHALAHTLSAMELSAVFSTPYQRTTQTAAPVAAAADLEVQLYDPRDSAGLVEAVLGAHADGVVLVVGHSNTVGEIVEAFSGQEVPEISEAEHDNLYLVTVRRFGADQVRHLRYGDPG